jgi:site-specific DNA recombinase
MVIRKERVTQKYLTATVIDIYCRVSTDEQEENTSLELQEKECKEWLLANGYIPGEVKKESYTGTLYRERKKLSIIRDRYRRKISRGVIVRTLDRLSRDQVHFAVLIDEIEHSDAMLLCVKEQFDNTPQGKFMRDAMAFVAAIEREKIMDRTLEGKRNTILDKGHLLAGKKALYGYQWNIDVSKKREYYLLKDAEAEVIQFIHRNFNAGMPVVQIYKKLVEMKAPVPLECWSISSIRRILKDHRYTGKNIQAFANPARGSKQHIGAVEVPDGLYPAIITQEEYDQTQKRLMQNAEEASRNASQVDKFLLRAGFVKCAHCKNTMAGRVRKQNEALNEYYCTQRYQGSGNKMCFPTSIKSKPLDGAVWAYVEGLAEIADVIAQAIKAFTASDRIETEIQSLENSIVSWEQTRDNYLEDLRNPLVKGNTRNVILSELNKAEETLEGLVRERALLQASSIDMERVRIEHERIIEWCEAASKGKENGELTYDQKRELMRLIGIEVWVTYPEGANGAHGSKENVSYEIKVKLPELQAIVLPCQLETADHEQRHKHGCQEGPAEAISKAGRPGLGRALQRSMRTGKKEADRLVVVEEQEHQREA